MKPFHIITLLLVIVGGVNWGLVGLFNFDLVATIFGAGSPLSRLVYILVGASALTPSLATSPRRSWARR